MLPRAGLSCFAGDGSDQEMIWGARSSRRFVALALAAKHLVEPARILEGDTEALRKLGKRERAVLDEVAAFPRPVGGARVPRTRAPDEAGSRRSAPLPLTSSRAV